VVSLVAALVLIFVWSVVVTWIVVGLPALRRRRRRGI
jgi:hypothetical protein